MNSKRILTTSVILGGILLTSGGIVYINRNDNKSNNEVLTQQPQPKYSKKSATSNEINNLINQSFNKKTDEMLNQINNNHDVYMLVIPDDDSFYKNTQSVPTKEDLESIIKGIKRTGKPCYAIKNSQIQTVNNEIKNQQEKEQVQATSPFMLVYFNSENGKTSSTNLLSSVDTQRSMVVKQTLDWINNTSK